MIVWNSLSGEQQQALLQRPGVAAADNVRPICEDIMAKVQQQGDSALKAIAAKLDKRSTEAEILCPQQDIIDAQQQLSEELKAAIEQAYTNIKRFHQAQQPKSISLSTQPGVSCELRYEAIDAVGIYVPGGSAPLPSSVLMQGVLAQLSGASTVILATPVKGDEQVHPAIRYAAKLCGITQIMQIGGAAAIAAMAFGSESIPQVNKIFGPGNAYVTMAKQIAAQQVPGLAIDMPAGPSEVLIIADSRANGEYVAADLLSQAEHGPDSQVILLSDSDEVIAATERALERQLATLSRADIARQALAHSALIKVADIDQAVRISNIYGPEHLILQLGDSTPYLNNIKNVGSIFVGDYTPESAGDYASGTNHVLPTYGYSKVYSSLSLLDFYRTYTVQTVTKNGLADLANAIIPIAEAEGLDAHANAVRVRLGASS
ncbi:histidinol dehydrogenase [Pseudoalteromonas sp. SW0106-04]|uniref:histidinol dehydrogenase n=1 Tax=Pseudoalteromonas sp. SW0106-04 TaxID=1702169 RepID=UPI0006B5A734|nr:histidinol dehydrogenase [Pseudoalteromonas sp. SW0106-04]GAP73637.1 histidinol dehydrogenase [Pseudoalteromonas sp. SW0106-04]